MYVRACLLLKRGGGGGGERPTGVMSRSRLMSDVVVDEDKMDIPRVRVVGRSGDQLSTLASSLASSARDIIAWGPE